MAIAKTKKSTPLRVSSSAKKTQPVRRTPNPLASAQTTTQKKQADPIGTATITCNSLNVRQGPGTSYARIGGLTRGQTVEVYEDTGDWLKIKYGSETGYIAQQYTNFKDKVDPGTTDPVSTPDPGTTTEPEKPAEQTKGKVVNVTSSLNVRSGPGTSYGKVGSLGPSDTVVILGKENGWYKIEYAGGVGYVSGDYIEVITGTVTEDPGTHEPSTGEGTPGGISSSKGTIDYKQFDSRWASLPFTSCGDKSQTYKSSACGPTSAADVVWSLRDSSVTPVTLGTMCVDNGYRTKDNGTAWGFFPFLAGKYNLNCTTTTNMDTLKSGLANGGLAVCSMGAGYWTSGGHYICIWKYDGSTVYANDPGSSSRKSQNASDFKKEMRNMWIFK